MAIQVRRPILVGGLGLVGGLWIMEALQGHGLGSDGFGLPGLVALGAGVWWWRSRSRQAVVLPEAPVVRITRAQVEEAIAQAEVVFQQLDQELSESQRRVLSPELTERFAQLRTNLDRQALTLAVVGGPQVGKTALIGAIARHWQPSGVPKLELIDTAACLVPTIDAPALSTMAWNGDLQGNEDLDLNPGARSAANPSAANPSAANPDPTGALMPTAIPDLELGSAESSSIEPEDSLTVAADELPWAIAQGVLQCDWVLFVVAGDISATEVACVRWLQTRMKRVLVVVNKQDLHAPEDQTALLARVRLRLRDWLEPENIVAIAAQPSPIQQRSSTATPLGSRPAPAEVASLCDRLNQGLVLYPFPQLPWATELHNTQLFKRELHNLLNQLRRQRAMAIVEQYQWIAGGAAFVNPVPSLDLLATLAVNGQLIVDIAKIYQQPFSLDQGKTVAIALGEMLVKLGLVEVSTQTLGTLLKTNGLTFWAGGFIQGLSAAHLTRVVGLSLIEYLESLELVTPNSLGQLSLDGLRQTLQRVFQTQAQTTLLQRLLSQGRQKLTKLDLRKSTAIAPVP